MTTPLERSRALLDQGRHREALAEVEPFAASARAGEDVVLAIQATLEESKILSLVGEADLAVARATWAISIAHAPQHHETLGEARNAWDVTMTFLLFANASSDHEAAGIEGTLRVLDEGERFLERVGRPEWRCGLQSERAAVFARFARHAEAVEQLRAALEGKLRCPEAPGHTAVSVQRSLARSLVAIDQHDEARAVLERLLREPGLKPIDELACHTSLGHSALDQGDGGLAARCADRAIEVARGMTAKQQIAAAGLAVEAYLAVGRHADARAAADEVMRCANELGTARALCSAHQDAFDVALAEGDLERAGPLLDRMEAWALQVDARTGGSERRDLVAKRRARLHTAG